MLNENQPLAQGLPATLPQVIEALRAVVSEASSGRNAWFAAVYYHMTQAVQQGITEGRFQDGARMERLDVVFANRYLEAWQNHKAGKKVSGCWQLAFSKATSTNYVVLQHLLLGMNAHINYDLALAASAISTPDTIHALATDFHRINDVISGLAGRFQTKLASIWWPLRMLSNLAKGKDTVVLNFSVEKARRASWANAVALTHLPQNQCEAYCAAMDKSVTELGLRILTPDWVTRGLLAPVKWLEEKDIRKVTTILNENPS